MSDKVLIVESDLASMLLPLYTSALLSKWKTQLGPGSRDRASLRLQRPKEGELAAQQVHLPTVRNRPACS